MHKILMNHCKQFEMNKYYEIYNIGYMKVLNFLNIYFSSSFMKFWDN